MPLAPVTIRVTPPPNRPTLSIGDVQVEEDDGSAVFEVRRSGPSAQAVTVEYETSDVTALAGSDYAEASGTLTIFAGATTGTIRVTVLDDSIPEGDDETFRVELSNPNGATISDGVGEGTIEDDDAEQPSVLPELEIRDVTVTEGVGASAQFTVTLSEASGQAVTVDYATSDVTALAGSDYTEASGTLTIEAGETTGTITVEVLDDGVVEGEDETFTVKLSGPSGATIADDEGVGTITDDDVEEPPPGQPTLRDRRNATSGRRTMVLRSSRWTLSEASGDDDVTVDYATSDVTAKAGSGLHGL